ncbi:MAG: biosynthetic-type acetolactate synthase large subunit [Clostridia bacterium]|nr:biosynthetic-type acetolactate synthase large subunit [Clostridia bacterium]
MKGAEILIECLKEQGVDTVFGYPGGTVLDMYDALYMDGGIRHILTSHEQGAAHAADAYARVTGKVGVCMATSGPGATNLVTGIATAFMDSVPLVAITGNVSASLLGRDSFQEIDIVDITIPVTKHNFIVKDVTMLADVVRKAFYIASSGRKGPVLIDILKNVQQAECEYTRQTPQRYGHAPVLGSMLYGAAEAINSSLRPLVMCGGGVVSSDAGALAKDFAEKICAPVCYTLMGKGAVDDGYGYNLGMVGMHGSVAAAKAVTDSDLIIALGTRFSDRVALDRGSFAKGKKVVQVEIDNAEINKNIDADISVLADVGETLKTLIPLCKPRDPSWRKAAAKRKEEDSALPMGFAEKIIAKASETAPRDGVLVTDVGQHQMWAAQHFGISGPRRFCSPGGLGTMGYSMGAAMGASVGSGKVVTAVCGDGGFRMCMNEYVTAVHEKLPMVVLLMDNSVLGMVRQWQKIFYGDRFSQTDLSRECDYVAIAAGMGGYGLKISSEEDIGPVLEKAYAAAEERKTPVLVDCVIDRDENILPMIKPNSAYDEQITELKE